MVELAPLAEGADESLPFAEPGPALAAESVSGPVAESPWVCLSGRDVLPDGDVFDRSDGADELVPVEPAAPVVSADATGIDATAQPTPKATASAPTRPTYRA